jgi:hypothetical protein
MAQGVSPAVPRVAGLDSALRVGAVVAALALVIQTCFIPMWGNDFWLQARVGQVIVETGEIPRTVLFPFTEAQHQPFNAHEWLPSVLFHLLDQAFGYERLNFVLGALGLTLFAVVLASARRLTGSLGLSLALALMASAVANYRQVLRPEILALVLMALLLWLLASVRSRGSALRKLPWVVPMGALWANTHGSFLLGPGVCGLFALGQALQAAHSSWRSGVSWRTAAIDGFRAGWPYAAAAGAMALASLLNPLGVGLWHFALSLSTSEITKMAINEWQATLTPDFMVLPPFVLFVGAAVLVAALLFWRRRQVEWTDLLLLLFFLAMALGRRRFIVLFGFVAAVVCAMVIGRGAVSQSLERVLLLSVIGTSIIGMALASQFGNARGSYPYYSPSHNFSEPMVRLIERDSMRGNVFNSYELGAELIYRAYPRLRPSIDSRIDSYGDDYYMSLTTILVDEPRLNRFLATYDVNHMLLLWRDFNYLKGMKSLQDAGWRMEFADHKAVLLTRVARPPKP